MKMQYRGFKDIETLPNSCLNKGGGLNFLEKSCNVSFKNFNNLVQDTDGIIYCKCCGLSYGQFKPNSLKVTLKDNNINYG